MNGQEQQNKNRLEESRRNNPEDLSNKERLAMLRKVPSASKEIKNQAKQVFSSMGLIKYLDPFMDWLFGIALMAGLLKDISDLIIIGALPVIGTLITFLASTIIFLALFLTGSSSKKKKRATPFLKNKYVIAIAGSLMEALFGINFLPIETIIVVIVFYFTLQERQQAEEEQKNIPTQEAYA